MREEPSIIIGGIDLVDHFYDIFSRNMRDLGTPVYGKGMFIDVLERFSADSNIVLVKISGRPAAGAFLIHYRGQTEVPWASASREFNKISINMFLYWQILKFSIERGSKVFDFGRSTYDSGTYRFKKQWGAEPKQLCWNYILNEGNEIPMITPTNAKYRLAIKAWSKLPVAFCNTLGPYLAHRLP